MGLNHNVETLQVRWVVVKRRTNEESNKSSDCQEALQKARLVVETQYSVVGVMEEFNTSLAVMEAYLPGTTKSNTKYEDKQFLGWFSGGLSLLNQIENKNMNRNPHPQPGEWLRRLLGQKMKLDIDFYRCKNVLGPIILISPVVSQLVIKNLLKFV